MEADTENISGSNVVALQRLNCLTAELFLLDFLHNSW